MDNPQSETCMMMIMFPITSDEQAIEARKKIKEVIGDIKGLRFDFRITAGHRQKEDGT